MYDFSAIFVFKKIIQNNSNFFKVVLVKVVETNIESLDDEMVITGSMGDLQEEEVYRFFGEIVQHPKYGKQLADKFMVHFAVIITWPITLYVLVSSYYKKIKSSKTNETIKSSR